MKPKLRISEYVMLIGLQINTNEVDDHSMTYMLIGPVHNVAHLDINK
jgi:hypothetical protein